MKEEGSGSTTTPAGPPSTDEQASQRTIQASPGDVTSSRPVTEPTDSTKA
jgi:sec-independent protein translocase protein TatA